MAEHLKVRPVIVPDNMHDTRDVTRIAKHLYTEQRGRVVGNTVEWDELSVFDRTNLILDMESLLESMREVWLK